MSPLGPRPKAVIYGLFTLSGFAGLIYESIWSHYLKLLLGHAAYAQTLVLVIFLGGMALGAWLVAALSQRLARPLLAYVVIELALGAAGFLFDPTFRLAQAWLFDTLIPQVSSPLAADILRWSAGALLILPQSMLLGATFPLICAGLIRIYPALPGSALGWLYFTNSLGAAAGVLTSGFFLIGKVGLPGTIMTAALLNLAVGLAVYLLQRSPAVWTAAHAPIVPLAMRSAGPRAGVLLAVAALTGGASFFYEIGWIRMLSLVLGGATHSFELMLSAFIFGLALGSLFIRNRIDQARDPMAWLGWIQVAMAVFAVLSLPLYMASFDLMAGFLGAVRSNATSYVMFNLFSHALCFALMLPATFCAGMTLPLITAILLRGGHGEGIIGRVYAANTLGSIAGTLAAVHIAMPLLGLKQVVVTGAAIDLLLGLWILWQAGALGSRQRVALAAVSVAATVMLALGTQFDPAVTSSGVYRHGIARVAGTVIYYQDGKTATISASRDEDGLTWIATNGKVDGGLNLGGEVGPDEYTTSLLAMLPYAFHPEARSAAVIGMGTGLTTDTLLRNPRIETVDTIEIEPAVVKGARHFGDGVARTFEDPRSHIRIEDAKAYFARAERSYDIIVSEPSNPWVSGIATLFSREFYARTRRHLEPGGLLVQWIHLYEIDPPLVATVFNAIGESFADYAVYVANSEDILIVASPDRMLPPATAAAFESPEFAHVRERLSIHTIGDLEVRRLGSKLTLQPFFASMRMPANSDYFPILDQRAGRARFLNASARPLLELHRVSNRLEDRVVRPGPRMRPAPHFQPVPDHAIWALELSRRWLAGDSAIDAAGPHLNSTMSRLLAQLRTTDGTCVQDVRLRIWLPAFRAFVTSLAPYLVPETGLALAERIEAGSCYRAMGATERGWIRLLRATASSDWQQTRAIVPALLTAGSRDIQVDSYLVSELLLADLKGAGAAAAAQRLVDLDSVPDTLPVRYLRANIAALVAAGEP